MSFDGTALLFLAGIFGIPLAFVALGWWAGRPRETAHTVHIWAGVPHQLRVPLAAAGSFIAALVLALILDLGSGSPPDTTPPTRSTEQERAGLSEAASLWAPTPFPDRKAKRRHERQRSRQSPAWSAAEPPRGRNAAPAFGSDYYLDEVLAEQATATARQNERIGEQIDTGTAIDATRSAENLDRMRRETAAEAQKWCEPRCLDSPRDADP